MAQDNKLPAVQVKGRAIRDYLHQSQIKTGLMAALPRWLNIDRFLRVVFTSMMKNPRLLDCSKESMLSSVMQCAQFGLEPVLNRAHLIPYWNSKKECYECQFQPGYAGLVDLGKRSGDISNITAHVVYENDDFDIQYGTEEHLHHKPCLTEDRGKPIGVYAVWFYKDGTKSPQFIPLKEVYSQHRSRSQSYLNAVKKKTNDSPWITDEASMLRKTAVKASSKLQSLSIEFMRAVELDNAVEAGKSTVGLFLEPPETAGELSEPELTAKDFDATIPKETDKKRLLQFLGLCAEQEGRTVDDMKIEAAESPAEFWNSYHKWLKAQTPPKPKEPQGKEGLSPNLLLASFSRLTKPKLKQYEEVHREEIPTWPGEVQKAFSEYWQKKTGASYDTFLRRLHVINGEEVDAEYEDESTGAGGLGIVVCPETGEHAPLEYCQNKDGEEKPCKTYTSKECLARYPE